MGDFWSWFHWWANCIVDALRFPHDSVNSFLFHQTITEQVQGNCQCAVIWILHRINLFLVEFAFPFVQFGRLTNIEHHSHEYLAQCVLLCDFCILKCVLFTVFQIEIQNMFLINSFCIFGVFGMYFLCKNS